MYLKPAGSDAGDGDDGRVLQRAGLLQRGADRRRSSSPSGRSRRRCSAPAASGRRSPSCRFWLMIVSMPTAVLPVLRSPMISWRWPRPIGGHRVDGLDAGLQRLADLWRSITPAPAAPARAVRSASMSPRPSIGLPERVDHPAEERVADRHREDLAGALDLLALLDAGVVAEDDDADVADVEVQRDAERAALELEQLVGHGGGQALDVGDAVTGRRRRCRPPRGRSRRLATRRSSRSRSGSPPGRSSALSWLRSVPSLRCSLLVVAGRSPRQLSAGGLEPACDAAVDHLAADPDDQSAEQSLVELDLQRISASVKPAEGVAQPVLLRGGEPTGVATRAIERSPPGGRQLRQLLGDVVQVPPSRQPDRLAQQRRARSLRPCPPSTWSRSAMRPSAGACGVGEQAGSRARGPGCGRSGRVRPRPRRVGRSSRPTRARALRPAFEAVHEVDRPRPTGRDARRRPPPASGAVLPAAEQRSASPVRADLGTDGSASWRRSAV